MDKKERKDKTTESVVNRGLFLAKYSGNKAVAERYLKANGVPEHVSQRVLEKPDERRV